jgi:hypothetical protein
MKRIQRGPVRGISLKLQVSAAPRAGAVAGRRGCSGGWRRGQQLAAAAGAGSS